MRSDTIDAQLRRPGLSDTFLEFQQIFESIPEDIVERVGRLLAPVSLDALSIVQAPCSAIVDAYMSLLNNSDNRDSVPWIFLLLYFRNQFRNTTLEVARSITDYGSEERHLESPLAARGNNPENR